MAKRAELVRVTPMADNKPTELKAWALVEIFGHQRIVGMVTVDPIDFPGMVRVDVPDLIADGKIKREGFTSYFGKSALYRVTPITEASVRALLPSIDGHPATPLSFTNRRDEGDFDDRR